MLCGLLCCGLDDAFDLWVAELLQDMDQQDLLVQECHTVLHQLHDDTRCLIAGAELGLKPLLPDDDKPLPQRAKAVCDWSSGFLYGVGLAGVAVDRQLSGEAREALSDLSEVTRMEWQDLGGESDEQALTEVSEFLWVAAMLVHTDLVVAGRTAKS